MANHKPYDTMTADMQSNTLQPKEKLNKQQKAIIDAAVKKVVKKYGKTLRLLSQT